MLRICVPPYRRHLLYRSPQPASFVSHYFAANSLRVNRSRGRPEGSACPLFQRDSGRPSSTVWRSSRTVTSQLILPTSLLRSGQFELLSAAATVGLTLTTHDRHRIDSSECTVDARHVCPCSPGPESSGRSARIPGRPSVAPTSAAGWGTQPSIPAPRPWDRFTTLPRRRQHKAPGQSHLKLVFDVRGAGFATPL